MRFFRVLACVLCFAGRDYPSWRGQLGRDMVDNQRSCGAKIAGIRVFGREAGSVFHAPPKTKLSSSDRRSGHLVPIIKCLNVLSTCREWDRIA
jgi:hypothetical protein